MRQRRLALRRLLRLFKAQSLLHFILAPAAELVYMLLSNNPAQISPMAPCRSRFLHTSLYVVYLNPFCSKSVWSSKSSIASSLVSA